MHAMSWPFWRALTLVFSAKETIFKGLFPEVNRYFDFRDVAVVSARPDHGDFDAALLTGLSASLPGGHRVTGHFEYDERLVCTGMVALP